jgi:Zn-dependent oligopeptidase
MLTDRNISAQQALETARQEFQRTENVAGRTFESGERALDRTQQANLASAAQTFQASQAEKDRAQQIMLTDRNITAQQALETARQSFQRGESALDRAQQQTLETARQSFQATQANLDREQQTAMVKLQNSLSQSNVSGTFAANITANTSSAINAIMADGNLTPDAKRGAIDNIIANANSTLQWGSTFYNTTLPGMSAPGGTSTPITPGGNAAPPPSPTPAPAPTPTPAPSPAPRGGIVDGAMQRDAWGREPGDPMYGVDPNNISTDGGGA